jgi:ubiquinone/menaquinone biosynthesis C-methylase UbiE
MILVSTAVRPSASLLDRVASLRSRTSDPVAPDPWYEMMRMPPRSKDELRAEIEGHILRVLGPKTPARKARKSLDFEMSSVEIHRRNLVPFVRGHGARSVHHILDFGSGPGCSACAMALDLGARVTGVEPRETNRAIAPLWADYYEVSDRVSFFFTPDTLKLPFSDETFDFVLASSVLEYIPGNRGPYLREMWRVLKPEGRLLIAGTSNAAWPREVHSKTWIINWMPNLGPRIRQKLGRRTNVERGITFGEIEASLPGARFVRGASSEVAAFAERLAEKAPVPMPMRVALSASVKGVLSAIDRATSSAVAWPIEAFLPWLNVAFEKPR